MVVVSAFCIKRGLNQRRFKENLWWGQPQHQIGDINHYLGLAPSDTLGRVYRLEIALKLKEYDAVNEDMIWLYKTMGDFFLKDYLPILSTHFDASKKYTDFQKILIGLKQINPKELKERCCLLMHRTWLRRRKQ